MYKPVLAFFFSIASVFTIPLSAEVLPKDVVDKKMATDFLFSTLSLPDRTDYPEEFYIENINASFKAREELPWGKMVPKREFLHFVLPIRVNNENLDSSRIVLYEELKDRVKDLSMEDAILEINHWCHEHVTYQPSDARTSSPLSSISQGIGRCGEESTFTVAALRAVGIPARQIYTPRWAHTDDNHAWVEAWANGKWYFLGACEPEPVLNLGWFNAPASRGLLMTTSVAGNYDGPEETLLIQPYITKINVTENYAPVGKKDVKVIYPDSIPVQNAKVNFGIYNYAEYYPAVTKITDENGMVSLNSGLGDMVIWATDGKNFGYAKGRSEVSSEEPTVIVLDKNANSSIAFDYDIVPPKSSGLLPFVSEEANNENNNRKAYEDSLRNAYTSTFLTQAKALEIAKELNLDTIKATRVLTESRGNHQNLTQLLKHSDPEERSKIIDLLTVISEKDRRDLDTTAIIDHINNTVDGDGETYLLYVLNPRIENEYIRPWRSAIKNRFSKDTLDFFKNDPLKIKKWISENITLVENENPQTLRMSPLAVINSSKADKLGRDMFYVALARSAGLPSRIDPVTGSLQYLDKSGDWINVNFEEAKKQNEDTPKIGWLQLTYEPEGYITDPKYYSQFSLAKINNGEPRLLEFDEGATISGIFSKPVNLEEGQYMLTSGQRLADGTVLAHSEIFKIPANDTINITLKIRQDNSKVSVIGSLNAENLYKNLKTGTSQSILSTTGRGYYTIGLIRPNHEPSEHALNDISAVAQNLENDGRKLVILFDNEQDAGRFQNDRFPELPSNVVFGIDENNVSGKEIVESLHLEHPDYPLFVIADSFNRIVWVSEGYSIGLGEKILSVLSQLE